jgi:peptide/nickel transport system permease protein
MSRYIISRLIQIIPVLILVSMIVFALTMLLPGDPTVTVLGEYSTPTQRNLVRVKLGLDQPVPIQYLHWVGRIVQGDFGRSLRTDEPVETMLLARLPVTIELALLSTIIAVFVGIPLGIVAALRRNGFVDSAVSLLVLAGLAIPNFWVGILMIMLFSLFLGILPPSGFIAFNVDPWNNLRFMVMPAFTLGFGLAALVMRQTRAIMLEVLTTDFIRTAHAKGLRNSRVLIYHALRNTLIPLVTVVGLQFGTLLGGSVIIETIFGLPGLGKMIVDGIFGRDYPVIQGGVVAVAVAVLILNLIIDIGYTIIDPRIDFKSMEQR